jgi:hypothetical protein
MLMAEEKFIKFAVSQSYETHDYVVESKVRTMPGPVGSNTLLLALS